MSIHTCTSVPFSSLTDARRARDAYQLLIANRMGPKHAHLYTAVVRKRDDAWHVATSYFIDGTPDFLMGFRYAIEAVR